MSQHNITSPLSVLLAGVTVIILLLISSGANTSAGTLQQTRTPIVWTPCSDEDNACIDFQDNATASAAAYGIPSPYGGPASRTATTTGTATITTIAGTITRTIATGTPQRTSTPSQTRAQTPTDTVEVEQTSAQADVATLTATPGNQITCAPGVVVPIAGEAPPRAPLLLYFGERVVGGGSAGPNGHFELKLILGQERAGEYQVTARVRGTAHVLREVTCIVPNATATPLAPDQTAVATATPGVQITCAPGVAVPIAGEAPPRAPLLLYFGERVVVGGSAGPNGHFELKLILGQERAGEYQVTARVRGTAHVLRAVTCIVPDAAPAR